MIAIRVIGLMIAFACFNACIGLLLGPLNTVTGIVSSLIGKKSSKFFSVMDVNRDGIVEMKELASIADCVIKKLNIDEEGKKRVLENDIPKGWKLFGFDQAESGNSFHTNTLLNILGMGKYNPIFRYGVRATYELIFDFLRCYSSNTTITVDAFFAFHYCLRVDPDITPTAFDMINADKDGGISKDELCDAGEDYMLGEDENGLGALLMGRIF